MQPAHVRTDDSVDLLGRAVPSAVLLPAPAAEARKAAREAAAEGEKALTAARRETASAAGRLVLAEEQLIEERRLRARDSDKSAAQLAGLNQELSAAVLQTVNLEEAGRRERRLVLGISVFGMVAAIAVTILLFHTHFAKGAPAVLNRPAVRIAKPVTAVLAGVSAEARALDRLNRALSLLPSGSAPAVLRESNRWLSFSGAPPCSVESAAGEAALLVGSRTRAARERAGPLTEAFSRCAEAVEQTLTGGSQPDPPPKK